MQNGIRLQALVIINKLSVMRLSRDWRVLEEPGQLFVITDNLMPQSTPLLSHSLLTPHPTENNGPWGTREITKTREGGWTKVPGLPKRKPCPLQQFVALRNTELPNLMFQEKAKVQSFMQNIFDFSVSPNN